MKIVKWNILTLEILHFNFDLVMFNFCCKWLYLFPMYVNPLTKLCTNKKLCKAFKTWPLHIFPSLTPYMIIKYPDSTNTVHLTDVQNTFNWLSSCCMQCTPGLLSLPQPPIWGKNYLQLTPRVKVTPQWWIQIFSKLQGPISPFWPYPRGTPGLINPGVPHGYPWCNPGEPDWISQCKIPPWSNCPRVTPEVVHKVLKTQRPMLPLRL